MTNSGINSDYCTTCYFYKQLTQYRLDFLKRISGEASAHLEIEIGKVLSVLRSHKMNLEDQAIRESGADVGIDILDSAENTIRNYKIDVQELTKEGRYNDNLARLLIEKLSENSYVAAIIVPKIREIDTQWKTANGIEPRGGGSPSSSPICLN